MACLGAIPLSRSIQIAMGIEAGPVLPILFAVNGAKELFILDFLI